MAAARVGILWSCVGWDGSPADTRMRKADLSDFGNRILRQRLSTLFLAFLFVRNPRRSSYSRGTPSTSALVCPSECDPQTGACFLLAQAVLVPNLMPGCRF